MLFHSLASSSEGNCAFIRTRHTAVLIDCGISLRAVATGVGPEFLRLVEAVFITHEHNDHVRGVGPVGRKLAPAPVFMHSRSFESVRQFLFNVNIQPLRSGAPVTIKDLTIIPFPVVHDSENAFGFFIAENQGASMCYMTDTGRLPAEALDFLHQAQALFIESNYDEIGLTEYPDYTSDHKARIRGTHLCNDQTLDCIECAGVNRFDRIILGHLSPRTNRPEWVRRGFESRFPDHIDKLMIAPTEEPVRIAE